MWHRVNVLTIRGPIHVLCLRHDGLPDENTHRQNKTLIKKNELGKKPSSLL